MLVEVLTTFANVTLDLFTLTSKLAIGIRVTITQIVNPLRNLRLVVVVLAGRYRLYRSTYGLPTCSTMTQPSPWAVAPSSRGKARSSAFVPAQGYSP